MRTAFDDVRGSWFAVRRSVPDRLVPRRVPARRRPATGRPSGRRGRCRRATSKFPPYEIQTLPNGLQVVAVLHHEQPVVSMRLLVRAGSAADPKEKLGLARLTASLLDQGTDDEVGAGDERRDRLHRRRDGRRRGHRSHASRNMVVMKDSFETGMRMLSDMARQPGVRAGRNRAPAAADCCRVCASASRTRSTSRTPCSTGSSTDSTRTACRTVGTPETIAGITRNDLVAFHQRYFAPNNAILAIVGDVTAEEAFSMVKKVFGDWERRDVAAQKFSRSARADATRGRSSTSRTPCRPRCASVTSASRAIIPTTWR